MESEELKGWLLLSKPGMFFIEGETLMGGQLLFKAGMFLVEGENLRVGCFFPSQVCSS